MVLGFREFRVWGFGALGFRLQGLGVSGFRVLRLGFKLKVFGASVFDRQGFCSYVLP